MERVRVSLADIAKVVGCSVSTVSLALNHDEKVRASTREAVERAAKELGYVPNLVLAALARKRFKPMPTVEATPVVMITEDRDWLVTENSMTEDILARAAQHGLEVIRYSLETLSQMKRPDRILYHRGIEGILLSPLVRISELGDFDWSLFSVVGMSTDLDLESAGTNSFIHRVSLDYFWSGQRCWLEAQKAGYHRIGIALNEHSRVIADDSLRIASALLSQYFAPQRSRIPLLRMKDPWSTIEIRQWVEKYQPDVVIGQNVQIAQILEEAGWKIPRDMAFINLVLDDPAKHAGIIAGNGDDATLDFLASLIRKRQRGLPVQPQTVLVHPTWSDGPSLPPNTLR